MKVTVILIVTGALGDSRGQRKNYLDDNNVKANLKT